MVFTKTPLKYRAEDVRPLVDAFMQAHGGCTPSTLSGHLWENINAAAKRGRLTGAPADVKSLPALLRWYGIKRKCLPKNKRRFSTFTASDIRDAILRYRHENNGNSPTASKDGAVLSGPLQGAKWGTIHQALIKERVEDLPKDVNTLARFCEWMDRDPPLDLRAMTALTPPSP